MTDENEDNLTPEERYIVLLEARVHELEARVENLKEKLWDGVKE